jgi:hypothetical protein
VNLHRNESHIGHVSSLGVKQIIFCDDPYIFPYVGGTNVGLLFLRLFIIVVFGNMLGNILGTSKFKRIQ